MALSQSPHDPPPQSSIIIGQQVVPLSDLALVRSETNNAVFYAAGRGRMVRRQTLTSLAEELPDYFFRINRRYLINLHWVRSFVGYQIVLRNGLSELPDDISKEFVVARSRRGAFLELINRLVRS